MWINRFGPEFTQRLRRRRSGFGDTYFLDEVFVRIGDKPSEIITDKLRSYSVAPRSLILKARHNTEQYANNQAKLAPHLFRKERPKKSKKIFQIAYEALCVSPVSRG